MNVAAESVIQPSILVQLVAVLDTRLIAVFGRSGLFDGDPGSTFHRGKLAGIFRTEHLRAILSVLGGLRPSIEQKPLIRVSAVPWGNVYLELDQLSRAIDDYDAAIDADQARGDAEIS